MLNSNKVCGYAITASCIILLTNFLFRLIDYSKIIFYHPLSNIKHDVYSYLPQLFFLKACGFHASCPYWYNGIKTFLATPPGWYFFAYPFYFFTNSILLAFYLSVLAIFMIAFAVIWFCGKKFGLNPINRLAFFALFFANNVAINILRLGRLPELLAWSLFIAGFFIIWYYKDNKLTLFFYILAPLLAATILSYHAVGILLLFFAAGLLLIKRGKELFHVISTFIISFVLCSFWLVPLIKNIGQTYIINNSMGVEAWWDFIGNYLHFTSLAMIVFPICFFIMLYIYMKKRSSKDLIFLLPVITIIFLFLTGVIKFMPILKHIFTNIYLLFIVFITLWLFFNIRFDELNQNLAKILSLFVLMFSVLTITVSAINTPLFDIPTQNQNDVLSLLDNIDGNFLVVGDLRSINSTKAAFYSYGPIFLNVTTAGGHYPELKSSEYLNELNSVYSYFIADCALFKQQSKKLNVIYFITYGQDNCNRLRICGLEFIKQSGYACKYSLS